MEVEQIDETNLEVGDRIVTLERGFNGRRGFDRSVDPLPFELDGLEDSRTRSTSATNAAGPTT
ncbi:aldehyde ferredoxin oxidoreductase C-terminal domain-containing protein [Natronococcus wangiae]|uniref:aldehyde ferredoxin oxidoreductase C-terminal domain-containing protein n=1 Tax=Natronococcus wangiae TaxID=3068275 RepID=UPI00273FD853|nr:aldehyde ferredoxin oxidoreductase C-terminal domain-containing protein [Natronococcus sp. AD5]